MAEPDQSPRRFRQAIDALVYAIVVTGLVFFIGAVVCFTLGSDLVGVKYFLFLVGILLFGYGTFALYPSRRWKVDRSEGRVDVDRNTETGEAIGAREETRFQSAVQRVPPLPQYSIPPEERLSPGAKLFIASLFVLLASFLMEAVFGVGV
ncbi:MULTISPECIES: hypothetical protein [unclassified Haladaptatus]|uniref:DUF7555 family protein n=1 Tax=unclassified Haladaptatus TaxID=2622732 RepID=UPI00209C69DB|nr:MULTISPECIES: hypothetical protein [unclassified Haladaptatus]MCO8242660.1 hypothetical protein [Haladaptatus sp. AB643]MCO8252419.1 hypothetical protein [Haladaptatus sp. AB618]